MNGHKAIAARLLGYAGLTALVGTRITPDVITQPASYPAVAYSLIHGTVERGSTTNPGLGMGLFQVSSFDKTRLGARLVAAQVRAALDRWRSTTSGGVTVDECLFVSDIDLFNSTSEIYFVAADYRLFYRE